MRPRVLPAALGIVLAVCACRAPRFDETEVWVPDNEAMMAPGADNPKPCRGCNLQVYGGHICGQTAPCHRCLREQGGVHRHAVRRYCENCDLEVREHHTCRNSDQCRFCRRDGFQSIPARDCERCRGLLQYQDVLGITVYCAVCNLEVGKGHVHGKTSYCPTCAREVGRSHAHNGATVLCVECGDEVAPDHVHEVTWYCRPCMRETARDHRHGETEYCTKCQREVAWPHTHHD